MIDKLMLGTVQFGMNYGIANKDGQVPPAEVRKILAFAYEKGIRFLDTAASYGNSEEVLVQALDELGLNGKFNIVTKTRPIPPGTQKDQVRAWIRQSLETSLANLRQPNIYGCMFHREEELEYLPFLRECRDEGLIENYGISIDSRAAAGQKIECDILQLPMNILDCRFEHLETGAKIFARSAFLQGLLLMDTAGIPPALRPLVPEIAKFEAVRKQLNISKMEFYLRYNLSKPQLDKVIIGVNTLEHLQINSEIAAKGPLPPVVMTELETLRHELPEPLIRPTLWPKS